MDSKYRDMGDYHYQKFRIKGDLYREHILDVLKWTKDLLKGGDVVLDVGCGEGLFVDLLKREGITAIGFDIDEEAIRLGIEKGNDVFLVDFLDESHIPQDAIFFLDSLEHMDWEAAIDKAMRMTNLVFVAVPDKVDDHAEEQYIGGPVQARFESRNWKVIHHAVRAKREFFIFQR